MKLQVEVGQVYRDKDKRMNGRCVLVKTLRSDRLKAVVVPCYPSGKTIAGFEDWETHIAIKNLQTRFELVEINSVAASPATGME